MPFSKISKRNFSGVHFEVNNAIGIILAMENNIMGVYVYCIEKDYSCKLSILGRKFENEWFSLEPNGTIIVKGTYARGYSWDGCSPKWKIKGMYFGTPEAVLNNQTRQSSTYYASLIHDLFYQFSKDLKGIIKRKEADKEFYNILKRDGFKMAKLYLCGVRAFGWIWWGKPKFLNHFLGRP